jgi:hypothetical protein
LRNEESAVSSHSYKFVSTTPADTPLWVLLSKYTRTWPNEPEISKKLNIPVGKTDPGDFHIGLAVIQYNPDILVTSNINDLEYLNQLCQVLTPGQFLQMIDAHE